MFSFIMCSVVHFKIVHASFSAEKDSRMPNHAFVLAWGFFKKKMPMIF